MSFGQNSRKNPEQYGVFADHDLPAAVLAAAVLFIYIAGIRYIRVNHEDGSVKYFGTVDKSGEPLTGTLVINALPMLLPASALVDALGMANMGIGSVLTFAGILAVMKKAE